MRPAVLATVGLSLMLLPAACGGDQPTQPATTSPAQERRLTPAERARAQRAEQRIVAYCGRLARSLTAREEPPSAKQEAKAFGAARRLVELAREKPDAAVRAGVETRLFVSDLIEDLEGSNCDPRLADALEQGLAAVPP